MEVNKKAFKKLRHEIKKYSFNLARTWMYNRNSTWWYELERRIAKAALCRFLGELEYTLDCIAKNEQQKADYRKKLVLVVQQSVHRGIENLKKNRGMLTIDKYFKLPLSERIDRIDEIIFNYGYIPKTSYMRLAIKKAFALPWYYQHKKLMRLSVIKRGEKLIAQYRKKWICKITSVSSKKAPHGYVRVQAIVTANGKPMTKHILVLKTDLEQMQ